MKRLRYVQNHDFTWGIVMYMMNQCYTVIGVKSNKCKSIIFQDGTLLELSYSPDDGQLVDCIRSKCTIERDPKSNKVKRIIFRDNTVLVPPASGLGSVKENQLRSIL